MDAAEYVSLVFEDSFEADCAKLCSDVRVMDDHLRACDLLITRAPEKGIEIPFIPGTDVQVFRLDAREIEGHEIPPTRVFFRMESNGKAHMLNIEPIPPDEYFDDEEEGEQLEIPLYVDDV